MSEKIQERRWTARNPQEPWDGVEVFAAASHPGTANTVMPVVDRLAAERKTAVTLWTAGKVNDQIVPSFPFKQGHVVHEVSEVKLPEEPPRHRLVLAGVSTPPDVKLELDVIEAAIDAMLAEGHLTQIVLAEDNTAGLRPLLGMMQHARGLRLSAVVDRILLANAASARAYPEDEFGIPRDRMKVTGSPTFDSIKSEDTAASNAETRKKLGIPLETVAVAYFAVPSQEPYFEGMELKTTKTVSRAVRKVAFRHPHREFVFLYRRHPREERPEELRRLLPESRGNLRVIPHEDSEQIPTRNIGASSDANVSLLSTVNTESALRGARGEPESMVGAWWGLLSGQDRAPHPKRRTGSMPVYLLNADAIRVLAHTGYELPVTAQHGAAAVATNDDQLPDVIDRALFDVPMRHRIAHQQATALKTEYAFDPNVSSADLIVAEMEKLLREKPN